MGSATKCAALWVVFLCLGGCGKDEAAWSSDPNDPNNVKIEAAIRRTIEKPTGELTKEDLVKVVELNLSDNQIDDVSTLKKLKQLKELSLSGNKLSDVSALKDLKQLKELSLSGNQISDLSALKELQQLTFLSLDFNKISDVSLLNRLSQLTVIGLSDNQVKDVNAFKELKQLKQLYLYNNPSLTKAGVAALRRAIPKCIIYSNPKK